MSKQVFLAWVVAISFGGVLAAHNGNSQKLLSDFTITLKEENSGLFKVLNKIEKQTNFKFAYLDELSNKIVVSVDADNATLDKVLESIGKSGKVTFRRVNDMIAVSKAKEALLKNFVEEIPFVNVDITGKITDENNQGLPGASVVVKGTTNGTTTDLDGNYKLTVPEEATIILSFVGYLTQEVILGTRTVLDLQMQLDAEQLQEVVVTALGIKKERKTLGYATSKVESKEFTENRTPNFVNALQGKIAGVNITTMGSGPQGSSKIRIRGISSFGGSNSPLIIVNGVPIDNTNFGNQGSGGNQGEVGSNRRSDGGDGLSSINPDDVTSMTVLKGAAASALYGSRAKDGVIMITTRNGSEGGGMRVEFNSNFTSETPLDYSDFQYEYGQGEGGVRPTSPGPTSGVWSFGEKIQPGMTQILFDGLEVPYTAQPNKVKDYYRKGMNFSNTLTVSSGNENGGFSLSLSNMDSKSIMPGSDYSRKIINLGFTQKFKKLTLSGSMNYANEDRKNPPNTGEQDFSPVVIYTLASSMPLDLLRENAFDDLGNEIKYSRFTNRTNPYFALSRFEKNKRDRIYGNLTAKYDFTDWLYVQGRLGQDYYARDVEYNLPTGSQRQSSPPPGFVNGQYVQDIRRVREVNSDFLIGANREFGDFGMVLNAGGNRLYQRSDINTELGENFFTRDLYTIGNASKVTPAYTISEKQVNSLYGAAEISYKGFVYLNATLRNDWFSTLAPANRSVKYGSVTGSFVFSQAFENLPEWLSFGKIRVAYGEVGSDTDVPAYANNLFYGINTQQFPNPSGTLKPLGSINGNVIPNPDLKPMRVKEKEIGLEMTLFDNLRFEVSYYDKLSEDQILNAQISNSSGYTQQRINVGASENKGIEMILTVSPISNDNFKWTTSINATHNTSKVLSLGDDVEGTFIQVGQADFHGFVRQVVGQPMAQLYGFGYLRDAQGRQVFNTGTGRPERSTEQLNFGSALPTWWGGWTNNLNYKGVTFSFLIDFKLGHNLISGTHTNAYRHGLDKATLVGRDAGYVIGDGVNKEGTVNTTQTPVQTFYETIRSHRGVEQSVFNAGSWQLRQMSVGYDFTKMIPANKYIKGAKLSIVANNVAVLKSWVPHIHPDQNGIISDTTVGLEATGLPITRSLGFNLNIKF